MMIDERKVRVALGQDSYNILIGSGNLNELGSKIKGTAKNGVVISNPVIWSLYGETIEESLEQAGIKFNYLNVPEGEEYKSLKSASDLYDRLIELRIQRGDFLIALGGGVIGDLAGFVAATYMRGIPLVQVPTTLLAQVDSSIGGKVAVDHPKGKNMIGCFYQPKLVHIDINTLRTLPEREFRTGMAEVIKYAFLEGKSGLSFLEKNLNNILNLDTSLLLKVVQKCCEFKARIVEEDEKDMGLRAILNYGHTFGHAIEAATDYKGILHGEAIAIGMVGAAIISQELGWADNNFVERHINLLKNTGLPSKIEGINPDEVLNRIILDKKGHGGEIRFILLKAPGEPVIKEISGSLIEKALKRLY